MKPTLKFDLNVKDIDVIEDAMRYRLQRLLARRTTVKKDSSREAIDIEVAHIHQLLGKLYNQKSWFKPTTGFIGGG
jgi:hypothetical protein